MSDDLLFLDCETFSTQPISVGTHRYAEESEIMILSWAFGYDEPASVLDLTENGSVWPGKVKRALDDPGVTIVGANFGNFDRVVMRKHGVVIPPERIHDTMIQALSHGLPGSLDKLGEIFGISEDEAKHKEGKALIQEFCKPRPKNSILRRHTRLTHPDKWERFLDYAKSDITAMRYIYRHMPKWNYPGTAQGNMPAKEYALWCLDQRINDRGFRVDTELAHAAIAAVGKAQKVLNARTVEMTDDEVQRAGQRDKLLRHLLSEYGVSLPDMTKSTLERRLGDPELPDPVKELIAIRLEATTTSNSKYAALLKSVSADGRLRGTMQFCGAPASGRDSGRIFQPTNLPRPDMHPNDIDAGIRALKLGVADKLFDSPIKLASNAIRGAIIADDGKKLAVADLEQIEARCLPWLAGEQWKLDAFKRYDEGHGPDLYCATAGRILGREISKKDPERQSHGKIIELSAGYGGSVGAFHSMARLYGVEMSDGAAKEIVDAWRAANPAIADWDSGLWTKVDTAVRRAISTPNVNFEAGEHINIERWRNWLRMTLPSGSVLCLADPKIIPDPRWKGKMAITYMGLNSYTRQWEQRFTYGGKICSILTQRTARDVMFDKMQALEDAGYPILLRVHDELLAEPLDTDNYSVDTMVKILTRNPDWADDRLPLSADGFEAYRYRK